MQKLIDASLSKPLKIIKPQKPNFYLGLDIGATKTMGVLIKDKELLRSLKRPTGVASLIDFLQEFCFEFLGDDKDFLAGIGISIAGVLDKERTFSLHSPNIKILEKLPLGEILGKEFNVPVSLENDGNAFIWGEYLWQKGTHYQNIIGLTLGTGLGGGVIIDGKLLKGSFSSGAEIGHMIIKEGGIVCGCGNKGCFEGYASAQFFKKTYKIDPKKAADLARKDDKKAMKIYQEYGFWLGVGTANLVNLLDPEVIILGGSISNDLDLFIDQAKDSMKERILSPISKEKIKIKKAVLGELASAIGAAELAKQNCSYQKS